MKFGLSFLPDSEPNKKTAPEYFSEIFELCRIADQEGLNSIKMTEHYLHPYGGYCPSPLAFLSAVAAQTKQIRLMTGCILPVFHHPIQIAAKTAMLDAISNGRADIGFARAYLPYEFDAFEIEMDESRGRYEQTILTVLKLWTEPKVSVNTPFFNFKDAVNFPSPVQRPHPPVWGAAVNSRQSFSWIAEQGFNLLMSTPPGPLESLKDRIDVYRESFYSAPQNTNKKPQVAISVPLFIDENPKKAIAASEKYLQNYLDVWADAADAWSHRSSSDYPKYTGLASVLRANTPELMREQKQALVGCPEHIIDGILAIKEILQIDYILWQIDTGSQPIEIAKKSLNLFTQKILHKVA